MDINLRVFKEPRGLIRIIQQVMAILGFASTAGFSNTSIFKVVCPHWIKPVEYTYAYPFKLSHYSLHVPKACVATQNVSYMTVSFGFDFSSNAEFFVATGVLAFLYALGILALYIFANSLYTTNQMVPLMDLGATVVLTVFWLAGSSAWSSGVGDLKYYTNPVNMFHRIPICKDKDVCQSESTGHFGSLNVSLIVGFANFLLWGSSLWFIYKETYLHQQRMMPLPGQTPAPPRFPGAPATTGEPQYSVENQYAAPPFQEKSAGDQAWEM